MTEPKLQEGLEKLKKLDPETWESVRRQKLSWHNRTDFHVLQGAIQDAIAARGWGFYLSSECDNWSELTSLSTIDEMKITYATSILIPDIQMADFWDGDQLECKRGDSAAEAILAAFIQALEAQ